MTSQTVPTDTLTQIEFCCADLDVRIIPEPLGGPTTTATVTRSAVHVLTYGLTLITTGFGTLGVVVSLSVRAEGPDGVVRIVDLERRGTTTVDDAETVRGARCVVPLQLGDRVSMWFEQPTGGDVTVEGSWLEIVEVGAFGAPVCVPFPPVVSA